MKHIPPTKATEPAKHEHYGPPKAEPAEMAKLDKSPVNSGGAKNQAASALIAELQEQIKRPNEPVTKEQLDHLAEMVK